MSTTAVTRRLFSGLLDDAAMFPPGNAPPAQAVRDHLRHRSSWYADLVGPLLVHGERWQEFQSAHEAEGSPELRVVVVSTARRPDQIGTGLTLLGYEAPAGDLPTIVPPDGLPLAAEIVDPDRLICVVDDVAALRARGVAVIAKYRTGGESADAYPSEATVARVLSAAVARGVPLKYTAGLHAAVRHTNATTGFEHHGFLNPMAATRRARAGESQPSLMSALASRDAGALVTLVSGWSAADVAAVRGSFVSFGCCGVEDPIAELVTLGLVDTTPALAVEKIR